MQPCDCWKSCGAAGRQRQRRVGGGGWGQPLGALASVRQVRSAFQHPGYAHLAAAQARRAARPTAAAAVEGSRSPGAAAWCPRA